MTREENLFITAMEECAELQQAISKSQRFGLKAFCDKTNTEIDNNYEIIKEYIHVQTMINMLISKGLLQDISLEEKQNIADKKIKAVIRYQEESVKNGLITE